MATYFFDKNGATAGFGTLTGNWADVSWSLSGAGTSGTFVTWPGAGNVASFGGTSNTATAGTITAAGTINLDGIIQQNLTGNQTYNGGTLNFGSVTGTINLLTGNASINSAITGTNGLTHTGSQLLFLYGSFAGLTGTVTNNSSTFLVPVFKSSYTTTANFTNSGTGFLGFYVDTGFTGTVSGTITSSVNTVSIRGDALGVAGTLKLTGDITGISNFEFYNGGVVYSRTLPAVLTFSGYDLTYPNRQFYINASTTQSRAMNVSLEDLASVTNTIGAGASADAAAAAATISGTIAKGGTNAVTFSLDGTSTFDNTHSGNATFTAANNVAFEKNGGGKWIVSGDKTGFKSSIIKGGTLRAASSTAIGGALTMSASTVFEVSGGITLSNVINAIGTVRNVSGSNSLTGTSLVLAGSTTFESLADTLTVNLGSGASITGATQPLTFSGAGNHTVTSVIATTTGTVTKNGAGTTTFNGANSFSGSIAHNAGVIEANTITSSGNNSLGTGTTFTFGGAATLRYTGSTPAELSKTVVSVPASGAVFENNGTSAWTVSSLTAANAGTVLGLAGSNEGYNKLSPASTPANLVGFTKTGAGRWISTLNVNPASGSTAVNGGTLVASNSNGTSKLFGYDVTVESGAKIQTGSDEVGQAGKCAYNNLTFNGVAGTPARIRIGGSVVNPTIYMTGTLTIPAGGMTWNLAGADVFKTPGTYTLVEFGPSGSMSGSVSNITVTNPPTGRSVVPGSLTYNSGTTPKTITVQIA